MPSLQNQGHLLTTLTLAACDLLCARTLDPWSRACPNLADLTLVSCDVAVDTIFVGELPELDPKPFPGEVKR